MLSHGTLHIVEGSNYKYSDSGEDKCEISCVRNEFRFANSGVETYGHVLQYMTGKPVKEVICSEIE